MARRSAQATAARHRRVVTRSLARSAFTVAVFAAGAAHGQTPVQLPEFFVPGERIAPIEVPVPRGDLEPPAPNPGSELLAIPGVYAQSRAADAMEPNLRGLGFDRVATTIDGIPLVNASPERTNSPVVMVGGAAITGVSVAKVLPSVTLGPAVTGGRIALSTDARVGAVPESGGLLNVTGDGARRGWTTDGRFTGTAAGFDATVTEFRDDLFDYRAADGRKVAARLDDYGESTSLGWTTGTQHAHVTVLHRRLQTEDTVSLPLDGKNTDATIVTFNYRWSSPTSAILQQIDVRLGGSATDPFITSEDRVSPPISAQANARTLGGTVVLELVPASTSTWRVGTDTEIQRRRAVRTTPAGQDYIWPGVRYDDVGVFSELERSLIDGGKLRIGARLDDIRSAADDADRPALGQSIRLQYAEYNGPTAANTDRHTIAGAANALLQAQPTKSVSAFVGSGYSVQAPQAMEQYRAFLNALGGDGHGGNAVELGNPALRPERKLALECGATVRTEVVEAEAAVYWYRVDDFIVRTPVGFTQPPQVKMLVFGYRNTEAELGGAELGATWHITRSWNLPVTFAIAEGRNRQNGTGLAEIPPWELNVAWRGETTCRGRHVAIETGTRVVGSRTNPAPQENPLFSHAGGFAVWHARIGAALTATVRIEVGVENALNRGYTEYLTPPVAPVRPASGDLQPGEQIPAPGRSCWIAVSKRW